MYELVTSFYKIVNNMFQKCQQSAKGFHSFFGLIKENIFFFFRMRIHFFSCDKIPFSILGFCNSTWDGFLCWPFTPPGVEAKQLCPENVKGILRGRELFVGFFIEKNVLSSFRVSRKITSRKSNYDLSSIYTKRMM